MKINNAIDFKKIFDELIIENRSTLELYKFESDCYQSILYFIENDVNTFNILNDECELKDKEITFIFEFNFDTDMVAKTQIRSANYVIVYDNILSEFTKCEYEQL